MAEPSTDALDPKYRPASRGDGHFAIWLFVLIAATAAVRLAAPTGWHGADDALYYSAADNILHGSPLDRFHHHSGRMAMILPIAASITMFGASTQSVIMPTVVASILCVLLVAVLGRMIWGPGEGIIAAAIVSFLPSFRLYSSSAYPDVHACLWATSAIVLAFASTRTRRAIAFWSLGIACGLCVGLATSAKIFSITVIVPVGAILCAGRREVPLRRLFGVVSFALGFGLLFLIDGIFYTFAANDFFFKYHTLSAVQGSDDLFAAASGSARAFLKEAWHRVAMPFDPDRSTWGVVAVAFWPAAVLGLVKKSPGRLIAFWAVAAYLLMALAPVRFRYGPQIFPFFSGRTALTTCIPFALCTGWLILRTARRYMPDSLQASAQPVAIAAVILGSFALPSAVEGVRNSHTKLLGLAIRQAIDSTDWNHADEVFVHPSTYMRYRLLFPQELRAKLRVAADDVSPAWWRDSAWDVNDRVRDLPAPGSAYLLATPAQLRAEPERWDYGVMLPRQMLGLWSGATPLTQIGLCGESRVDTLSQCDPGSAKPLVSVVAGARSHRVVSAGAS